MPATVKAKARSTKQSAKRPQTVAPPKAKRAPKIKAAERVAAELRRDIATGVLRAGDRLPSERLLQEQFDISRPTLREALRLLESESLIEVARGQHGGGRVCVLDIKVAARQVGVYLQMEGTTLQDVWIARSAIEPAAAGLLAKNGSRTAILKMEENIAAAYAALGDPTEYGALTTQFSDIITDYCGNRTLKTFARLVEDIVRRQHVDVTVKTYAQKGVEHMRKLNIRGREKLLELIRTGNADGAEAFWKKHLEGSGAVVFTAYRAQMPIDVVQIPKDKAG
jgi:DNA-binding FadR family transcriptional regulator